MTQWGLDTLFNPAKRHMDEEKRRLQSTRSEVGDNSGGRRIDLASGKVKIRRSADDEPETDAPSDEAAEADTAAAAKSAAGTPAAAEPVAAERSAAGKPAPSAAALRAAARRGRTPR